MVAAPPTDPVADPVIVARVTSVYGVAGWVRLHSYTEPDDNLFGYSAWWIQRPQGWQQVRIDAWRRQGDGFIAHLVGVDDRDVAREYCQQNLVISRSDFKPLPANEYYWQDLLNLNVYCTVGGERILLGQVVELMETGANDVLVVRGPAAKGATAEPAGQRERLIPYLDQYVLRVDMVGGEIHVDWDPHF